MRTQLIANIPADPAWRRPATRVARHYQWAWGGHVIDRLAQLIQFLDANFADRPSLSHLHQAIPAVYGVNLRTGDAQGLDPHDDVSNQPLDWMDNDEGYVVVDIAATKTPNGLAASYEVGILTRGGDLVTAREYLRMYPVEFNEAAYEKELDTIENMAHGTWFDTAREALTAADALVTHKN